MRTTIHKLIELLVTNFELPSPVFEFGSLLVESQKKRSIRPLFIDKVEKFVTCDMQKGAGVDRVLNLHHLDLSDKSVGTVILLDTIEHVQYPWKAFDEIFRVLKPGGFIIFTSHMYFPVHRCPFDYWRFTEDGFTTLMENFDFNCVEHAGLKDFPHTVVGVGVKGGVNSETSKKIKKNLQLWKRRHGQSWKEYAALLLPPVLLVPLYRYYSRLDK